MVDLICLKSNSRLIQELLLVLIQSLLFLLLEISIICRSMIVVVLIEVWPYRGYLLQVQVRSFLLKWHLVKCSVKIRCRPTTSLTKLTETSIYDSINGDLALGLGSQNHLANGSYNFSSQISNDLAFLHKKSIFPAKIIPDELFLVISHFIIGTVLFLMKCVLTRLGTTALGYTCE